jgi:hypothetical protein
MSIPYIRHKRGDTVLLGCTLTEDDGTTPVDVSGWAIASQIRGLDGTLLVELEATITDGAAGEYALECAVEDADTSEWALGLYEIDIEYTDLSGRIVSTETAAFQVIGDVTREEAAT